MIGENVPGRKQDNEDKIDNKTIIMKHIKIDHHKHINIT